MHLSIINKIKLVFYLLFFTSYSFAVNTDESTRYAYWLMTDMGTTSYSIVRHGGYPLDRQYYSLAPNLALNIVVRDNQHIAREYVTLSTQEVGDLIRQAITTFNTVAFINFRESDTGRALRIDMERSVPASTPGYAAGFPPRGPGYIYMGDTRFESDLYYVYNPTGGIAVNVPAIQDMYTHNDQYANFTNYNTYNYLMIHNILAPGTTITDYVRMQLRYTIMHEFMHVLGAIHGATVPPGYELPPFDDLVYNPIYASEPSDGGLLYNYNNPALVNSGWRPSVVAPSFSQTPVPAGIYFQNADNYFVTLAAQLGRPIQLTDIRPALQDVNMMACDFQFVQQQAQQLPPGQQQLCRVNLQQSAAAQQPIYSFMNYEGAGLLQVGIDNVGGIFFDTIYAGH